MSVFSQKNLLTVLSLLLSVMLPAAAPAAEGASLSASCGVQEGSPVTELTVAVTDASGAPVAGASVVVSGTFTGAVTDAGGRAVLKNIPSDAVLEISCLGYAGQKVPVAGNTSLDAVLEEDTVAMEEVVVTGYGNGIRKASLTGAISDIGGGSLSKSTATHVGSALAGKIAGINFRMPNGEPGAVTKLNIRNMGTPLYVIDGMVSTEGSFNNLNFNDIESISVLKDASAAIYGLRSGNGVVVVTTKRGRKGEKAQINVDSYFGMQSWFRFPRPADADTYVRGLVQSATLTGGETGLSPAQIEAWRNGTLRGFDWYDFVVRRSAPQWYLGVNASGGGDKSNWYASLGRLDQKSVIHGYGGFERWNAQMNFDSQVGRRLKIGAGFNGRYEKTAHPAVPGDDIWAAIFAIYRNPPVNRPYANDNPDYPAVTSNTMSSNFAILNYDRSGWYKDVVRVAQLNIHADWEITDGLTLRGQAGYYIGHRWYDNQEYTYDLYSYDEATDTYPVVYSLETPFRQRIVSTQQQITSQLQLIWEKRYGRHSISAVAVAETSKEEDPGFDTWSRPLSNSITTIDIETLEKYDDWGRREAVRAGFAGRINYSYDDRYLLEVAARYDGSWRYAPGKRWGFFPSVSGGWRVSQERFWRDAGFSRWFNTLKVRASYGLMGDEGDGASLVEAFAWMPGFDYPSGGAALDGEWISGAVSKGLPITSISWLKVHMLDVGLDFGFFGNRLTGSVDYFRRVRRGLPESRYDVLLPEEVGFTLPKENLNSDMVTGVDGMISWNDTAGDWQYSVAGSFTYARFYDWHQYKPRFGNSWDSYRNSKWERMGNTTWGYVSDGQFSSWDEIRSFPVDIDGRGNSTLRPGDIKYKDINGDGVINHLDQRPIGYNGNDAPPALNFGFNIYVRWRDFDLTAQFAGGAVGTYHINYEVRNPFWDGGNTAQFILGDQWHLADPEDPSSELIPGRYPTSIAGNSEHSNYWTSDFWYRNVAYVKLKNLEIGWNLPRKWLARCGIQNMRIYLMGQNLFSIDNLRGFGIDPEIANESALAYPTSRLLGAGIKITF